MNNEFSECWEELELSVGLFDLLFGGNDLRMQEDAKEPSKIDEIMDLANRIGLTLTKDQALLAMTGRLVTMTPEQQGQWHKLITERWECIRRLKIDSFKALPASIRQYIIDSITWTRSIGDINQAYIEPLPEERAFEDLHRRYEMLHETVTGGRGHHSWGRTKSNQPDLNVFTVEGGAQYATIHLNEQLITLKQLIDAHAEQCLADGITGDLNK
jgi:hypothetical protein